MNKSDEHPLYCDHLRSSHWGYLREPEARAVQEGRYGIRTTYFIVDAEERKLKRVVVYEKETMCTVRVFWVGDKDEAGDT